MARFITRVQLIDSQDADYNELHEEMKSRGFSRTISGLLYGPPQRKAVLELPHAEYWITGDNLDVKSVRNSAASAAASIKKRARVFTAEIVTFSFVGLEEVGQEAGGDV